ncbi:MAG TPA: tyramine oxidase [Acidobacteriota bacterium]|nr:tyramine oxidase [Acidobacteriota bacterium]
MRLHHQFNFFLIVILFLFPGLVIGSVKHPLDALTSSEITRAATILKESGNANDKTLFASIKLEEPLKSEVLAWKPTDPIARSAEIILRKDLKTFEAIIDLIRGSIVSLKEIPGGQPFLTMPEILAGSELVASDPRMQEGLRKRGITDFKQLFCATRTVGNFGEEIEKTKRLTKVDCFDIRNVKSDVFANPIEGLFATVDLDQMKVIEVTDLGVVPIPTGNSELDTGTTGIQKNIKPVIQSSPEGSNIVLDGSFVKWQKWSFHVRWDIRSGVEISLVQFKEKDEPRLVLYQGYLSEIFVPYQDPTKGWYFRNYMDEGDFGFGTMGSPLVPGADCPDSAKFISPVMSNASGGADTLENRICIFERATGEPVWRHFDFLTQALESRPATELIVRYIATVGNYDYVLDWIFDQKGNITYKAGATGIDGVKGVKAQKLSDKTAAEDTAYGPLISPGRVGTYHDHFLSLRLDLDVDGQQNTFMRNPFVVEKLPADSVRKSIWTMKDEAAKTDTDAKFKLSYEHPSMWHVMNMHKTNALGYPVAYMIHSEANALPLIDPNESPLNRAAFANYHLWVTPYNKKERYAAGDYPNQSTPGQGLPQWTSEGRNIEDTDIVLWYTMGFHHVPSAEDWPVYNLGWHSVTLKAFNFFDRNPALDAASAPKK